MGGREGDDDMRVVFHMTPNSTGAKRYWDKFHLLADYLVENHNATILLVGTAGDSKYVGEVIGKMRYKTKECVFNMVGLTDLDGLIFVLRECDLLVCVNSFVMHLGVCLGVKMFAIVGATEPKVVLPPGIPHAYSEYARDIPLQTVIDGLPLHQKK